LSTHYSKYLRLIHLVGDLLLLNIAFICAYEYKFGTIDYELLHGKYLALGIFFNLSWFIIVFFGKIYNLFRAIRLDAILYSVLKGVFFHVLLVAAFIAFRKAPYYSREHLLITYFLFSVSICSWRIIMNYFLKTYRKLGYNYRRIIVAGYGNSSLELKTFFQERPEWGYRLLGFFDNDVENENVIGKFSDIPAFVEKFEVDEIFCVLEEMSKQEIKELTEFADSNLVRIKIIPDYGGLVYKKVDMDFYGDVPVLSFRKMPLDDVMNRALKRTFDIIFSLIIITLIFSWLFPIIGIIIKLNSRGPIFFKQMRSGKKNIDFWCYKFRSMYVNNDADNKQATRGDSRITSVGAFLRKTSIDELPQFINVFLGNMSVVGPRPHMLKHTEEYSQVIDKYMVRHFVKPGITGLAQAKGYRGETIDPQLMKNRVRLDIIYVENWSLWLDVKIIIMTILSVFNGKAF